MQAPEGPGHRPGPHGPSSLATKPGSLQGALVRTRPCGLAPTGPRSGSGCAVLNSWLSPEPRELLTKLAGAGDLFGQSAARFLSPANHRPARWSHRPRVTPGVTSLGGRWAPSPSLLTPNLPRPLCLARNTHAPSLLLCSQGTHSPRPRGWERVLFSCCLEHGCNVWWGCSHFATPGTAPHSRDCGVD